MEKQVTSWDDSIKDYINWSNASPQPDSTASLQKHGLYSEYTMYLSLCKKSHIAERSGKELSMAIQQAWVTVNRSALNNVGLGLFAARIFETGEVLTIYQPKNTMDDIILSYLGLMKCLHTIWVKISSI